MWECNFDGELFRIAAYSSEERNDRALAASYAEFFIFTNQLGPLIVNNITNLVVAPVVDIICILDPIIN